MKKNKYYISAFAIMLILCACSKDDPESKHTMSVSLDGNAVSSIAVDATGTMKTFQIKANGAWSIVLHGSGTRWLQISPSSGNGDASATIFIDKNTTVSNRNIEISFMMGMDEVVMIPVAQTGYGANIVVTPASAQIDGNGGRAEFSVATNGDDWEYSNPASDWLIQAEKSPTGLKFLANANKSSLRTATITLKLTNYPQCTAQIVVSQDKAVLPQFITLGKPAEEEINLGESENINFDWTSTNIESNFIFLISASEDMNNPLLSIETAGNSQTVASILLDKELFKAGINSNAGKSLYWTVKPKNTEISLTQPTEVRNLKLKRPEVKTDAFNGNLFDAVFNPDLSATDASANNYTIAHRDIDHTTTVSYNKTYKRYEAVFNPKAGNANNTTSANGDFYYFDYISNQAFKDNLADGHSFECLIKFDVDYTAAAVSNETKWFSTMGSGGTGYLIRNSSAGNFISFLSHDGGYKFADTQVKPDGKSYYHVVGVFDATNKKVRTYLNGQLVKETDAPGAFRHSNSMFITLGADPGGASVSALTGEGCFKGRLVIARMFNNPLTDSEVTSLWNQIKP